MAKPVGKGRIFVHGKPILTISEFTIVLGGLLLIAGFFFNWISYIDYPKEGGVVAHAGWEFGRDVGDYPEVFVLPFIGIFLILGAAFASKRRHSEEVLRISKWGIIAIGAIVGTAALFIPIEIAIRYSDVLCTTHGITFFNNADIGWYMCIFGSIISFFGAYTLCSKKMRTIGFTDFVLARPDETLKEELKKAQQPVGVDVRMPSRAMPPGYGYGYGYPPRYPGYPYSPRAVQQILCKACGNRLTPGAIVCPVCNTPVKL